MRMGPVSPTLHRLRSTPLTVCGTSPRRRRSANGRTSPIGLLLLRGFRWGLRHCFEALLPAAFILVNLRHLDLSHNEINAVENLADLSKLEYLGLAYNNLVDLDEMMFEGWLNYMLS